MLLSDCANSYLSTNVLMKTFMTQFARSPLLGMFVDRNINSKINSLHLCALRIVCCDNMSSFEDLLVKHKSMTVHHCDIHFLAIEMLGIAPMADIFDNRVVPNNCVVNGLKQSKFYNSQNPKTVYYGIETLKSLRPKIWDILPINVKNSTNLDIFKRNIKTWIPTKWPLQIVQIMHSSIRVYLIYEILSLYINLLRCMVFRILSCVYFIISYCYFFSLYFLFILYFLECFYKCIERYKIKILN